MFCVFYHYVCSSFFFFNDTATTEIYTLSLHDAFRSGKPIKLPNDRYEVENVDCTYTIKIKNLDKKDAGKVKAKVKDVDCTATLTVTEKPVEFVMPLDDQEVLEGEPATFEIHTNKPHKKVTWFKDDKEIKPNDKRYRFTDIDSTHTIKVKESELSDTGKYTIKCDNIESTATLTVKEHPCKITRPLKDMSVMEEESVTFTIEISKQRPVTWLLKGEPVEGDRFTVKIDKEGLKHTLTIESTVVEDTAEITVQIDDQSYGIVTANCKLTVKALPVKIVSPLKDQEAMEKASATFTCKISKPNRTDGTWEYMGHDITPSEKYKITTDGVEQTLTICELDLKEKGQYSYRIEEVSTTANLKINELPANFVTPLGDYRVVEKNTITLECEVTKPDRKATWKKGKTVIKPSDRFVMRVDGTKHFLTIKKAQMDDEDKYSIVVDDNESTGKLIVEEAPAEFVKPLSDQKVNEWDTATFECEVSKKNCKPIWKKAGKQLMKDKHFDMASVGTKHILTIRSCEPRDRKSNV